MRLMTAMGALLLLTACPEDPRTSTATDDATGVTNTPDGPPGDQPVGDPGAGPPGEGERPNNARFEVAEGEGVTLSGAVTYEGDRAGSMRVDFLTVVDDQHPALVHAITLEGAGPFSMEIPKDFGELFMVAFIDVDGDGPTPTDPAASANFVVAADDVTGVELLLLDEPDLGVLTPGGSPNMNAGPAEDGLPRAPGADPNAPVEGAPPEGEAPEGAPPEGAPPEGAPGDAPPPEGAEQAPPAAEDAPPAGE